MATFKLIVAILLGMVGTISTSIVAPAVHHITYTRAVPYNVLPFANSVNVFTRTLGAPVLPAYTGYHPGLLRTPVVPGLTPAIAPLAKVSSFLPAPFAAPGIIHAPAIAPVARAVAPAVSPAFAPAVSPAFAPAVAPAFAPAVAPAFAPAVAPAFAPAVAPAFAPAVVPAVASAFPPALHHAVAPGIVPAVAPAVAPVVASAYAPAIPASVAPVVRTVNPYYPNLVPSPINPAYGRSIHAVAPAASIAPAVHAAPAVPVTAGVPAPIPTQYVGK